MRLQVLLVKDDIKESRGNQDIVQLHSVTFFTKRT
jgi:hypothetical protein